MITTKQRAFLRSKSNDLPNLVYVGKEGVTANVIKQVQDNLFAHELIKIKVQAGCELTTREISDIFVEKINAEPVSLVGSKIVLYKPTNKKGFKHFL